MALIDETDGFTTPLIGLDPLLKGAIVEPARGTQPCGQSLFLECLEVQFHLNRLEHGTKITQREIRFKVGSNVSLGHYAMTHQSLNDLTPETPDEVILVRSLLARYRNDRANGKQWSLLWPERNGVFYPPVVVPQTSLQHGNDQTPTETTTVQVMSVETEPKPKRVVEQVEERGGEAEDEDDVPPPDLSECHTCREAVLVLFRHENYPRSAQSVQIWLADHQVPYTLPTVESCLLGLKSEGILSNKRGKGYFLKHG